MVFLFTIGHIIALPKSIQKCLWFKFIDISANTNCGV